MHSNAIQFLSKSDKVMKQLVAQYEPCAIKPHSKYFQSLCRAIISQQLSVKAAATIERRFHALLKAGQLTPQEVLTLSDVDLRAVGLSGQKTKYVRSLAENFLDGSINPRKLRKMEDEEVIASLTKVHGIGRWTAEMFLIFTLNRPDVFSIGDLGLRNAVKRLYDIHDDEEIVKHAERWKPHRSVASWYLWRSLEND